MSRRAEQSPAEPAPVEGAQAEVKAAVGLPLITFDQAVEAEARALLRAKIERLPWCLGMKPELRAARPRRTASATRH